MDSTSLREQELKLKVSSKKAAELACAPSDNLELVLEATPDLGDQYEVLEVLGSGGMGTVYKVEDRINGDTFAVKVLKKEVSKDNAAIKRFEQEVVSASKLTHSNLVSVYKHGSTKDGSPYLVMDYYEGENLAEVLTQKNKLSAEEAIDLFIQLGAAISHAHKKGVIHRDIKPTNVIISKGEMGLEIPRVVDFGIAKVLPSSNRDTLNFTETGEVFGSPEYMSPEQCLGFNLDHKSDIYSFGCLMYETLTGHTPFAGQNPIQLVVKHINEDVPEFPSDLKKSKLAKELESVVLKCLEKEPENRFLSMDDLVKDLELLKDGKPIAKYTSTRKVKPTLTSTQAYGGFILIAFALIAVQGFIATYYSNISESASSLIMGALFTLGAYVFGSLTFAVGSWQNFWRDKELKTWWKQLFCLSTFLLCTVVGASLLFSSAAPLCGIDYLNWPHIAWTISIIKWAGIISALSMVAAGAGSLVLSYDKVVGWRSSLIKHNSLLLALYLCCLIMVPNLAARLPVYMGEASSAPIASWLFDKATLIDSTYTRPLELLCNQEIKKGDYTNALLHINKLIELDNHNAYWFSKRSKIYDAMGDTSLALADNDQAQALRPLELSFIDDRVNILIKTDKPIRALAALDRALYNDPGSLHYSSMKAAVYARLGRFEDAIKTLDQITQTKDNKNPFLHLQRAEYYRMLGSSRLARIEYNNAITSIDIWWHDVELMPLVRAYAYKHIGQIRQSEQQIALMEVYGLKKSELAKKLYSNYSGLNLEW